MITNEQLIKMIAIADEYRDTGFATELATELLAARARIAELEAALTDWHRAWITDCIGPIANGNTYNGIDEGIVLSCRMMTLILKKTRDLLEVNNEQ